MKKLLITFVLFALLSTFGFAGEKNYEVKSGIIEYKTTSSMNMNGSSVFYFDNWGENEGRHSEMNIEFNGMKQTNTSSIIKDGDVMYMVNHADKTYYKEDDSAQEEGYDEENLDYDDEELEKNKIGEETIAGKKCDVYSLENGEFKVWMWKKIPLKTEAKVEGMSSITEAVKVQVDIKIPKDKISIPAGYKEQKNNFDEMMNKFDDLYGE